MAGTQKAGILWQISGGKSIGGDRFSTEKRGCLRLMAESGLSAMWIIMAADAALREFYIQTTGLSTTRLITTSIFTCFMRRGCNEKCELRRQKRWSKKRRCTTTWRRKFDLPEHYGRNLDALFDCLCEINGPTLIKLKNENALEAGLKRELDSAIFGRLRGKWAG